MFLKIFVLLQIKNLCDAPLHFHINKICVKEGYSLPELKVTTTDETDGQNKNKKGKKEMKKPKTKKKDTIQKQHEIVPEEWVNHFENNFFSILDKDMFSFVGVDGNIVSVLPDEITSLKIQYSEPVKQKVDKKGKKRSRSENRSKSANIENRKRSKSEGNSPDSADNKINKEKANSLSSSKQKGKKGKVVKDAKNKIYLAKFVITLGGIVPVREWIIIVCNRK